MRALPARLVKKQRTCLLAAGQIPSADPFRCRDHAGSYSLSAGSLNCTLCPIGTASSTTARSTACGTCPVNTYSSYAGSTICK